MRFISNGLWNNQGTGKLCICGIDRLIYHHSVYSNNILMCLLQGCYFWYQSSHCLQHFVETPVTLQVYFFQKIPELSWQTLLGTLTYKCFASVQCEKGSMHLPLKRLPPMQRKTITILWLTANSILGHKLIEKINTIHFLVVALKRF